LARKTNPIPRRFIAEAERSDTEDRHMEAMAGPCTAAERSLESRIPGESLAMAKD
jgi:hypothetical protein